ncbi:MAG: RNA methyltransferase [Bacteroidales bacterium]|nr:RNA methyltransferase [Bacteroidales bacterium]
MITKNQIKHINSLKSNKFRKTYNEFIVEGVKLVDEILNSNFKISSLFATENWITENENNLPENIEITEINEKELKNISGLTTANEVIAIVKIPENSINTDTIFTDLVLVLDKIRDPGNLGTIIRTADWFGIKNIICSNDTVDLYNPKVIQATMGSVTRVNIHYADLAEFLKESPENFPVYGTFLEGENFYTSKLPTNAIIVIGNESNGISKEIAGLINRKIFIPPFSSKQKQTAESLNASIAAALVCSEFRRIR